MVAAIARGNRGAQAGRDERARPYCQYGRREREEPRQEQQRVLCVVRLRLRLQLQLRLRLRWWWWRVVADRGRAVVAAAAGRDGTRAREGAR